MLPETIVQVNAGAMLSEVDGNTDGEVSKEEWLGFWANVLKSNYTVEEVTEEVDQMMDGGSWVDWDDNRSTTANGPKK